MSDKERFVIMARHFLDSFNPQPTRAVVILDCILAFPQEFLVGNPEYNNTLRHMAHSFVQDAYRFADMIGFPGSRFTPYSIPDIAIWLKNWWENYS